MRTHRIQQERKRGMHSPKSPAQYQHVSQEGSLDSESISLSESSMPGYQYLPSNALRASSFQDASREFSQPHINAVIVPSKRPSLSALSEQAQRAILTHPISLYTPCIQRNSPELELETLRQHLFPDVQELDPNDIQFLKIFKEEALLIEAIIRAETENDVNLLITTELGVERGWHCDTAVAATFKLFGPTTEFLATESGELELSPQSLLIDEHAQIFYPAEHEILFHYGFPAHEEDEANFIKPPLIHRVAERAWSSPLHESHGVKKSHSLTVVASSLL